MTPEQVAILAKMADDNAKAQIEMFKTLSDALKVASNQMKEARKPLDAFNKKTAGLGSFLSTLNKVAEQGAAGHRARPRMDTLHKKAVGIIRN